MRIPHMKMSRAAWIPTLLLGAAAGLILLHDPDARDGSDLSQEMAGRSSLSGSLADLTAGPGISAISSSSRSTHGSKTALAATTSPPPASDIRSSRTEQTRSGATKAGPGGPARSMFLPNPPADPESMSVVTGRREAPEVSFIIFKD